MRMRFKEEIGLARTKLCEIHLTHKPARKLLLIKEGFTLEKIILSLRTLEPGAGGNIQATSQEE